MTFGAWETGFVVVNDDGKIAISEGLSAERAARFKEPVLGWIANGSKEGALEELKPGQKGYAAAVLRNFGDMVLVTE